MPTPVSKLNVLHQIALETTPGAGGVPTKRLQSLAIEPGEDLDIAQFAPPGYRLDTVTVPNKAWTSFKISGPGSYTEGLYPLENLFGTVTPTTVNGTGRRRVYPLVAAGSMPPKTWTHVWGDPNDLLYQHAYALLLDYDEKWSRDKGVEIGGAGIAQLLTTGASFGVAAYLPNKPMAGAHLSVYLDSTSGALGTTKVPDELLGAGWSVKGLRDPRWVLDRSVASYKDHVDVKPKVEVTLQLAETAAARAILAAMRSGQTYFLRLDAQGEYFVNQQVVTITGSPTGGTFTLTYKGQATAGIAWNAAAAAVQSALTALSTIGAGNATVTGAAGGPYTITCTGTLAQDVTALTASGTGLTGGTSPSVSVTAQQSAYQRQVDIAFNLLSIKPWGDHQGVWFREVTGAVVFDPTWNNGLVITSLTMETSL